MVIQTAIDRKGITGKALGLAALTVLLNGLIGHFLPPFGILLTPLVLTITTYLVCFRTEDLNVFLVSILTFLFVALNDISLKLYSGGSHDSEGLGWMQLLLFMGLVPTVGILFAGIFRRKEERWMNKILAIFLFIALVGIHLQLFNDLGLGKYY